MLEELSLAENQLVKLPMLPTKLISFNANHNKLRTKGVKANAFKVTSQEFLIGLFQTQHCSKLPSKLPVWKLPSDIQPFVFVFAAFLNILKSFFKGLNSFPEKNQNIQITLSKTKTVIFVNVLTFCTQLLTKNFRSSLLTEIKQTDTSVSCSQWTGGRSSHSRDCPDTSPSGNKVEQVFWAQIIQEKNLKQLFRCFVYRTITFRPWLWTPSAKLTTLTTSVPTWTRSVWTEILSSSASTPTVSHACSLCQLGDISENRIKGTTHWEVLG